MHSHDLIASDHARGREERTRFLVSVAIIVVVAVLAAGCSSSSSSSEEDGKAAGWSLSFTRADGAAVPESRLANGKVSPTLVVGNEYVVSATVPKSLRSNLDGKTLELQHRSGGTGDWTSVREVRVDGAGRIRETFTAKPELVHLHDYRVAIIDPSARDATPTTVAAPAGTTPGAGYRTISATQGAQTYPTPVPFPFTSEITSAVGVVQYIVQIVNNTNNDLNVYIPTAQSNGTYNEGLVAIASGQTTSVLYTNPPPGSAMHLRVNKQKCFEGCTDYVMNWNWVPTESGVPVKGYSACSASLPKFTSNQMYKFELNDKIPESNFAAGFLSGALDGAGSAYRTCTFDLESKLVNWLQSNPVKGFLVIAAAAAVIAVAVVLTVATAGAAAPLDAAAAELVADAVVDVVAEDAAEDAAGDVVAAEVDAVGGAVPEAVGPEDMEFQTNEGYINPSSSEYNGRNAGGSWFAEGQIISNYVFK